MPFALLPARVGNVAWRRVLRGGVSVGRGGLAAQRAGGIRRAWAVAARQRCGGQRVPADAAALHRQREQRPDQHARVRAWRRAASWRRTGNAGTSPRYCWPPPGSSRFIRWRSGCCWRCCSRANSLWRLARGAGGVVRGCRSCSSVRRTRGASTGIGLRVLGGDNRLETDIYATWRDFGFLLRASGVPLSDRAYRVMEAAAGRRARASFLWAGAALGRTGNANGC